MKKKPMIILDEHPNWLEPLYNALVKRCVAFKKQDISDSLYNPLSENIYPFYVNRLSPSAGNRGHEHAFSFALNYIAYLEKNGARVVNGSHAVLLETSKAAQSELLRRLAVPQPKTRIANNPQRFLDVLDEFVFPVVIKPNVGGSGMGIQKFLIKQELITAIAEKTITSSLDGLLLLQEFIQPKDANIVRVETLAGKVLYAMKVFTNDTFNLCPSDSCDIDRVKQTSSSSLGYCVATPSIGVRFELYNDIPTNIIHAVEKIMQSSGLEVGGIEYVVNEKGDWFVYDINALSILRSSFKEEYGIDGWGMLADYFIQEFKKITR